MIYIETGSNLPYINLAFEEFLLTDPNLKEDVFMLWQNIPTIVVGRYQDTHQEINFSYTKKKNIHVVRRITGGGTVYHDMGNVCYSFILNNVDIDNVNFSIFAEPIVLALQKIGVNVMVSGRNDIVIEGAKCSGTAMKLYQNRILFHGTLLFDSNLSVLSKALSVDERKISSKGLKSVRSRVANIKSYMTDEMTVCEFKERIKEEVLSHFECRENELTHEQLKEIKKIASDKYMSEKWTFENNPKASLSNDCRFPGGQIKTNLILEGNKIKECTIRGDFIGIRDVEALEEALQNVSFKRKDILEVLKTIKLDEYIGSITADELCKCILME